MEVATVGKRFGPSICIAGHQHVLRPPSCSRLTLETSDVVHAPQPKRHLPGPIATLECSIPVKKLLFAVHTAPELSKITSALVFTFTSQDDSRPLIVPLHPQEELVVGG
jgi:hypothetical protein